MLTERQVATLRAALLYWQEEMCPHGEAGMRPYLDSSSVAPLNASETAELRRRLNLDIRYAVYDPARNQLDGTELFHDVQEASLAAGGKNLATVIIPSGSL